MADDKPFTGSADVFEWLSHFIHIDRGQSSKSFRLDRINLLADLAGHPEKCAPAIHIAGSKGKGSVTGMITAMLEKWGRKTARYTSPHVSDFRERITSGNAFFEEPVYITAGEELRTIVRSLDDLKAPLSALFNPDTSEGEAPTFFELMTLYYFLCARIAQNDVLTVETGLGGRLDSTNILDPLVSVITSIELEHTEFLGETIREIAGEKAGIIKPGRPLILMEQEGEALEVFREEAAQKNSPLLYFPEIGEIRDLRFDKAGSSFVLNLKGMEPGFSPMALELPIPGEIQAKNAGLAVLAVKTAFPDITPEAIREGLKGFTLPARFERILDDPPVIIDGAHTPRSTEYCIQTFRSLYGDGGILIFGCAAGKNARSMALILAPHFSQIIITTPGNFKTSYPEQVYDIFKDLINQENLKTELLLLKDTPRAIDKALELGKKKGLPVLGIGSFYLAADIRNRA
jgi:dihydrofolate synthase/folylpolyglutamate synthase